MNTTARDRALEFSLLQRTDRWKAAAARAQRLAREPASDLADATQMADDYRLLAHDLARARRLIPDTRTREYLEAAYVRAHNTLYRTAWHPGYALLNLFRDEIPAVVRWLTPHILWATAIFILTVFAGYWMVHTYPDLIGLFASPDLIATVERGQLWTEGILNIVPSSVLSLQILTNNIVVSLFAYCAGFVFGLGTLYILGLNGLMLGAVFAFTGQHGLEAALFRFIVAHGCVEISVMCLSGAAGAAVGEALIRPSQGSRIGIVPYRSATLRKTADRLRSAPRGIGPHRGIHLAAAPFSAVGPPGHRNRLLDRHDRVAERLADSARASVRRGAATLHPSRPRNDLILGQQRLFQQPSAVTITGAPSRLSSNRCKATRASCSCAASATQGSLHVRASPTASAAISGTADPRHHDKVRRRQQLHRPRQRIRNIRIIEIGQ